VTSNRQGLERKLLEMKPGKLWLEKVTACNILEYQGKDTSMRRFGLSRRSCGRTKSPDMSLRESFAYPRRDVLLLLSRVQRAEKNASSCSHSPLHTKALRSSQCRKPKTNTSTSHFLDWNRKLCVNCRENNKLSAFMSRYTN
jgi:hypothetical protein